MTRYKNQSQYIFQFTYSALRKQIQFMKKTIFSKFTPMLEYADVTLLFNNIVNLKVEVQCNVKGIIGKEDNVFTSNNSFTLTVQDDAGMEQFSQ